jgi:hypothetical protein
MGRHALDLCEKGGGRLSFVRRQITEKGDMHLTFLRRSLDLCGKTLDLTFVWETCTFIVSEGNLTCMGETLFNCRKIRKEDEILGRELT